MKFKKLIDRKYFRIFYYPRCFSLGISLDWQETIVLEIDLIFWGIGFGEEI